MTDALNVTMRWLHISSMMLLLGGVLFARLAVSPVLATLPVVNGLTVKSSLPFLPSSVIAAAPVYVTAIPAFTVATYWFAAAPPTMVITSSSLVPQISTVPVVATDPTSMWS